MSLMDNKVCVVTGGGGSLGAASAKLLLDTGAKVMLVDRNEDGLAAAIKDLSIGKGAGDSVASIAADVADSSQTQNYINQTVERWGKLDVLFVNAGVNIKFC